MVLIKIFILLAIIIASCLASYIIGRLIGKHRPLSIARKRLFLIIVICIIFCIPTTLYLPYMPFPDKEKSGAYFWIILGSITVNGHAVMDGLLHGVNEYRKSKKG